MAAIAAHANTAWQGIITPREAEVLELVARGYTNRRIGEEHFTTPQTVKFHLSSIYLKLGLRQGWRNGAVEYSSRVLAARWWWEHVELAERGQCA